MSFYIWIVQNVITTTREMRAGEGISHSSKCALVPCVMDWKLSVPTYTGANLRESFKKPLSSFSFTAKQWNTFNKRSFTSLSISSQLIFPSALSRRREFLFLRESVEEMFCVSRTTLDLISNWLVKIRMTLIILSLTWHLHSLLPQLPSLTQPLQLNYEQFLPLS